MTIIYVSTSKKFYLILYYIYNVYIYKNVEKSFVLFSEMFARANVWSV